MEKATASKNRWRIRRWIRLGFLLWAVISTAWLADTMRTRGVDGDLMRSGKGVSVVDGDTTLEFVPAGPAPGAGLVFFCGSGVAAEAYAPLLRPVAVAGFAVCIVKLPFRFAPLETHKTGALSRARDAIGRHRDVAHWVFSGHSLGGALAARFARAEPRDVAALVLIGTTHPKEDDLSFLRIPVTKIYATNDGMAPPDKVLANRRLLPASTRWIGIEGGNHSQFGHYGHQLFDGNATISREMQQSAVRSEILKSLADAAK